MEVFNTGIHYISLVMTLLSFMGCYGQNMNMNGFMPGVAPSSPNNAINVCLRQSTPNPWRANFTSIHARIIHSWCSVYDDVLPCLGRGLQNANRASDWYLKLIYNETMATSMSESICQRLPYLYELSCVDEGIGRVMKCMNWTNSIIEHFYSQFIPSRPLTPDRKEMATIYGCIISVTTASCFQKELTTCSVDQRKLMYDYYIMLSGKCREVAGVPETTTPEQTTPIPVSTGTSLTSTSTQRTNDTASSTEMPQEVNDKPRVSVSRPRSRSSKIRNNSSTVRTDKMTLLALVLLMLFRGSLV